jgi:hypothetical protein
MSQTRSTAAPLEGMTVQELQSIAAEAAIARKNAPRPGLSRAARLNLIDQLSRWGGSGLALFAGVSIFIMIVIARDIPLRSTIWASMIFASLYLCRGYRKGFRRGDHIASHPFRWRAYYTATLAVVSAAFGAGAFLILPESTPPGAVMQTLALMLVAATGAAAFHLTHRPSAAAAGLPAFTAIAGAAAAGFGFSAFTLGVLASGLAAAAFVALASAEAQRRAASRFPRTTFIRREIDGRPADAAQPASARAAS